MHVFDFTLADVDLRARYDALFESCSTAFIQQSSYWAEAIQDLGPDRPILLLCEEDGVDLGGLPLYLFEGRFGNLINSIPQPGPLGGVFLRLGLEPPAQERVYANLIRRALDIAAQTRAIALTIITNPFCDDIELYRRYLEPDLTLENFTQYIPLEHAFIDGEVRMKDAETRKHLRGYLRRARESELICSDESSEQDFDRWYAIHCLRHAEIGAPPLHRQLLDNIRRILAPKGKAQFFLVRQREGIASGALLIHHRDVVDLFAMNMDSRYACYSPNWLNIAASLRWSHRMQKRIFNWQSSPSRVSGVYAFKGRWGSIESSYHFVTKLFVPIAEIRSWGAEAVKEAYRNHYAAPFGIFTEPGRRHFRKQPANRAPEIK
ncbi:MAG TPA: GNAT family N-acetyltransferase [Bryobacteraceae bacterium]|nr:GNAT family N-acetyltransferase [Bryobacteraceae bacterium]